MFLNRTQTIENHLKKFIKQHFGLEMKSLSVETPPRIEYGDLAFPFPFELAKTLRQAPRQIAEEVVTNIDTSPHVERFVAAGSGYVNVFFKRTEFFEEL